MCWRRRDSDFFAGCRGLFGGVVLCVGEELRAGLWKCGDWAWGFAAVIRVGEERSICVRILRDVFCSDVSLRVEFLLKTGSGYPNQSVFFS